MTYGEKITSDERFNRTGLDLLVRMIYVEVEGESIRFKANYFLIICYIT